MMHSIRPLVLVLALAVPAMSQQVRPALAGDRREFALVCELRSPDGSRVAGVKARVDDKSAVTDAQGRFTVRLSPGEKKLTLSAAGYAPLTLTLSLIRDTDLTVTLQPGNAITVRPDPDILAPDPSTRVMPHEEMLEANPGRPGVPLSVPGLPAATASGGIKAPQYFAPGVAGDHGEPIAQFFGIGDFLFPNNLTANAHGNGYADPNVLVPAVIGAVQADGGAFNVRYGDHAVNAAVSYAVRNRLESFVQTTGDYRDLDVAAAWSPRNPATREWIAAEAGYGDGLLAFPEHRRQVKLNAYRGITHNRHELTIFGAGYYGFSRIPGLIPIDVPVAGGTIDSRQSDGTHTSLVVFSDTWKRSARQEFQFSGYFRSYGLQLLSNFGDGLIRQSEFRTVAGGNASVILKPSDMLSLMAGADVRRDAPREINLDRAGGGIFHPVTSNDLTISSVSPFVAANGKLTRRLQFNVGIRRDEFLFDNTNLLNSGGSYTAHPGVTSPKATLTLVPPAGKHLPVLAVSYGEAFHLNDPRIESGASGGYLIAKTRAWQAMATEFVAGTDFSITLSRFSNAAQLAKLDPDSGLQENVGPSLIRALTVSAKRRFAFGFVQGSFSRANAVDPVTGQPVPEAPRLIWDVSAAVDRLPAGLRAKGEFEYAGRKPLGEGFTAVAVREIRGYLGRSFEHGRWEAGLNWLLARGFSGQTLETVQLAGEPAGFERIVGVPLKSYASISVTYHLTRAGL